MERSTASKDNNFVLIVISLAAFTTAVLNPCVNVALPSMGRELNIPAVTLGWINNGWVLATAACLVPAGRLADIYGRPKLFYFGIFLFTLSCLLCSLANSGAALISFRVLQGVSNALVISTSVSIVTSSFPAAQRGRVLGIYIALLYLGLATGPFVGGILTENFGWKSIFYLSIALSLIIIILMLWKLKWDRNETRAEKFDLVGSFTFSLFLLLFLYGLAILPSVKGIIPMILGIPIAFVFVWWESRQVSPLLDLNLFRKNSVFFFSNLATLINYCATFAIVFLMTFYLQDIKALSPREAGIILLIEPVVMSAVSPFIGRLSDRVKPQILAAAGMTLNVLSLAYFATITADTSLWLIGLGLAVFGLGMAFFVSPNTNVIVSSVEKKALGTASAVQATARYIGMGFSMAAVMIVFSIIMGNIQITQENYPSLLKSLKITFIIFTVLCIFGVISQLQGLRKRAMRD